MAWIPFGNRPQDLQTALQPLFSQSGGGTVEEQYNEQEFGLLTDAQLRERIAELQDPPTPSPPTTLLEGDAFQSKSLHYLSNSADRPEDRRWAGTLHDSMLLELWLQHVTETGDTYYPRLADDLMDSYELLAGGQHS